MSSRTSSHIRIATPAHATPASARPGGRRLSAACAPPPTLAASPGTASANPSGASLNVTTPIRPTTPRAKPSFASAGASRSAGDRSLASTRPPLPAALARAAAGCDAQPPEDDRFPDRLREPARPLAARRGGHRLGGRVVLLRLARREPRAADAGARRRGRRRPPLGGARRRLLPQPQVPRCPARDPAPPALVQVGGLLDVALRVRAALPRLLRAPGDVPAEARDADRLAGDLRERRAAARR